MTNSVDSAAIHGARRTHWARHRFTSLAVFLTLCCVQPVRAQVSASIKGTVSDPSGAPVPSATVTVNNIETGALRSATTDDAGRYQIILLAVGEYEVTIAKRGFQEAVRSGIRLVLGQDAIVDFSLQVSAVKTEVRVAGDAPIVNTSTRDISGLVGEQQVKDLPLNGRSYDLLLPLNPGIVNFTSLKTGGTGISNSTTANNFAVSGNAHSKIFFC